MLLTSSGQNDFRPFTFTLAIAWRRSIVALVAFTHSSSSGRSGIVWAVAESYFAGGRAITFGFATPRVGSSFRRSFASGRSSRSPTAFFLGRSRGSTTDFAIAVTAVTTVAAFFATFKATSFRFAGLWVTQ